ncbi:MAG: hypothetical protein AVDCRST_MAG70-690 [uncultured Thermomicrobiales bacterium]|uniref:SpaA-like prealbumin fold domain-containing protein n=1 Tax=uncultured Thermomicrobiales bacterium TaxID=1645740 RepID=A0A6J4UE09_9BACT|nr:MAG: hypothetical protein AVDCRST_MAG70-690 [uncultured Thermomicrobiales bacterium]
MARFRTTWCLLLALILVVMRIAAVPATLGETPAVLADEGKDERGNGEGGKDQGEGKEDGKDDKNKDDNEKKDDEGKDKDDDQRRAIELAVPARVEVECGFDRPADQTTCTFTGVVPPGAKGIGHVDLPASEVCAEVVGGEYEYVDPDPNTRVVGYKSRGSEDVFSLVMTGEVTTGGTATYWIKTGDRVFPATGPGLVCGGAATHPAVVTTASAEVTPAAAAVTPEIRITVELEPFPTAEANVAGMGTVLVWTYACAEESPTAEFDWYGECEPGLEGIPFTLVARDGSEPATAGEDQSDAAGQARFEALAPGTYLLETTATPWCRAESDNVDERGELVVAAGAEVTVWIFLCGEETTK